MVENDNAAKQSLGGSYDHSTQILNKIRTPQKHRNMNKD